MSSILGLVTTKGDLNNPEHLRKMLKEMVLLGPHKHEVWSGPEIGLGSGQLYFSDASKLEEQPLISACGRYVLVSDSRLDYTDELSSRLGLQNFQRGNTPDSVLIMQAWLKWNKEAPKFLTGDFAVIIWDRHEKVLTAFRDHFGRRGLYVARSGRDVTVASAVKPLLTLPYVSKQINEDEAARFLSGKLKGPVSTQLRDVSMIPPATVWQFRDGAIEATAYWKPDHLPGSLRFKGEDDYVQRFLEVFDSAVATRIQDNHNYGSLLSGGLDSSSVMVTALPHFRRAGRPLPTFTSRPLPENKRPEFPDQFADETPLVNKISDYVGGLDTHFLTVEGQGFPERFLSMGAYTGFGTRSFYNSVWFNAIQEKAKQLGIQSLLEGSAGNHTISWGGLSRFPKLLKRGRFLTLFKEAQSLSARTGVSPVREMFGKALVPLMPPSMYEVYRRLNPTRGVKQQNLNHPVNPAFLDRVGHRLTSRYSALKDYKGPVPDRWPLLVEAAKMGSPQKNFLEAHSGIRLLDPTIDLRVVEFCFSLPLHQFYKDGIDRRLIRRAMSGKLPEVVINNRKKGVQGWDWFIWYDRNHRELLGLWEGVMNIPEIKEMVDIERVDRLIREWPPRNSNSGQVGTWLVLTFAKALLFGLFVKSL